MAYLHTATLSRSYCTQKLFRAFARSTGVLAIALLLMAAGWAQNVRAETRYVSDELTIPLRTGSSIKYRIIKFLESGTRLEVHETSENGEYSRITTADGDEGWVLSSKLMNRPSARDRIEIAREKLEQTQEKQKALQEKINELEQTKRELGEELQTTRRELSALQSAHEELRRITANPRALATENNVLTEKLTTATSLNAQLTKENETLRRDETKEWFILGASVSLGSLILGLIITRIPWRKRNSWGDL